MSRKILFALYVVLFLIIILLVVALVKNSQALSSLEKMGGEVFEQLDNLSVEINALKPR